jgi:N-ethylmaleimide reductase
MGVKAIEASQADAVALGLGGMFVANPDLPERIRIGALLNAFDRSISYGVGEGYTDSPTLEALVH